LDDHNSGRTKPRPISLRLFAGIAIPPLVNSQVDDLVRRLKPLARIRWSSSSDFHITTKFIGAWPEDRLEEMKAALAAVTGIACRIAIRGLGFYPNAKRPRIFWTGVEGGTSLQSLAAHTDEACAGIGVGREKKPYSPHLTLARIDSVGDLGRLYEAVEKFQAQEFGEFEATAFHLYLSRPGPGGSVYTALAEFPL
jgi:2'-5' RNA ligase